MRPIKTSQTNFTYTAPAGMPECDPLPCRREGDGRVVSVWEFTPEERAIIAVGGNLEFHCWTRHHPPIGFAITSLSEVPEAEARAIDEQNEEIARALASIEEEHRAALAKHIDNEPKPGPNGEWRA